MYVQSRLVLGRRQGALLLVAAVACVVLSGCGSTSGNSSIVLASPQATNNATPARVPSATPAATGTASVYEPTVASVDCGSRFSSTYVTYLPDADSPVTSIYDTIPLPLETRSYDDDATGLRVRFMCSAVPTGEVVEFVTGNLSGQGWVIQPAIRDCGAAVIPGYSQQACWQMSKYHLYVGVNSNVDWVIAFIDPTFVS